MRFGAGFPLEYMATSVPDAANVAVKCCTAVESMTKEIYS